jgi:hypothetical protein
MIFITTTTILDKFFRFKKILKLVIQQGFRFYPQHRTVPYPTVFRYNFYHARGLLARSIPFFLPKIHRFSAKKVKSANRTVFKIKTVLAFGLIYFKSTNRSAIILKQTNSYKSVSASRTVVKICEFL